MHTEKTKNREWVKTAAIIFLLLMLVLTFFSNTIMNRTLPEVASMNVASGTITAKVRGTGTVSAISTNEVKADATRYVDTVKVKEGQEVSAGDVLFIMGEGESEELEAAQDNLDALGWSLKRAEVSYPTYSGNSSLYSAWNNYCIALNEYNNAFQGVLPEEEINKYRTDYDKLNAQLEATKSECQSNESLYLTLLNIAETDYIASIGTEQESEKYTAYIKAQTDYTDCVKNSEERIAQEQIKVDAAYNLYEIALAKSVANKTADQQIAFTKLQSAEASYLAACDAANATSDAYNKAYAINQVDVMEYEQKIDKAQAKVDKLSGNANNEIVAKTSGIITTVEVAAGDKVAKDTIMATIEVPDMGYQMSFSATTDQAKRLKVGDTATISNYYWGSDITATVSSIKTDPKSPQTKKIITCDLDGNLTAGSELTVSIGQKSATYDMIVPNNSVKTDSNGTFVLVINSKNSPLGNRYFASRVDVEVLASDDVNSAVTGGLNAGDFVITTSSAPIKSGDQVRMADQ